MASSAFWHSLVNTVQQSRRSQDGTPQPHHLGGGVCTLSVYTQWLIRLLPLTSSSEHKSVFSLCTILVSEQSI